MHQVRGVAMTSVQPRRVIRRALSFTTVVIPNEEIRPLAGHGTEGSPCAGYDCCRILNHYNIFPKTYQPVSKNFQLAQSLSILIDLQFTILLKMAATNNLIERRNDILGGTPVFKGTRVPVSTFFEYLEAGHSLHDFLEDFPTVSLQQAIQVLERFKEQLLQPQ